MSTPHDSTKSAIPALARTFNQVCELTRDNIDRGGHWMMIDGDVVIYNQRWGHESTGNVRIPRDVFLRFIRWYLTGDSDMRRGVSDDVVKAVAKAFAKAEGK